MKKQEVEEEDSETLGAQVVVHAFKEKKNPGVHEERRSKFSNHNQFVVIVHRYTTTTDILKNYLRN